MSETEDRARIAALEGALRALVTETGEGYYDRQRGNRWRLWCVWCGAGPVDVRDGPNEWPHKPDCEIVAGRRALGLEGEHAH